MDLSVLVRKPGRETDAGAGEGWAPTTQAVTACGGCGREALGRTWLPLPAVPAPLPCLCFHISWQRLELLAAGGTWVFRELLHAVPGEAGGCPVLISTPGQLHWEPLPDVEAARMDQPRRSLQIPLDSRVNTAFHLSFPT